MYVCTFYSFKGGVGRSLALINTAHSLVSQGKTVLVVDFDLEAPGLDTFQHLNCSTEQSGVVDYVHDYLISNVPPELDSYIHRCQTPTGQLWVMPAGRRSDRYGTKFGSIDWQDLYVNRHGYLLIETLRKQWEIALQPDYVLIDSRTGHTDVGGICTRQLPDCVVLLFFPNEQNLLGISRIAAEIRDEISKPAARSIELLFVMANVPLLDDEDGVLANLLFKAKTALGYSELSSTIHHYDSLALLNQEPFVVTRPRTRLAREYQGLTRAISRCNIADKTGVLDYLSESSISKIVPSELEDKLNRIVSAYSNDGEVLVALSSAYDSLAEPVMSLGLLKRATDLGLRTADNYMRMSSLARLIGDREGAVRDLAEVLKCRDATDRHMQRLIKQLRSSDRQLLRDLPDSDAFLAQSAAVRAELAYELLWPNCEDIAERVADDLQKSITGNEHWGIRNNISLVYIGVRRYADACHVLSITDGSQVGILFNKAMAVWGESGDSPKQLFVEVVKRHATEKPRQWINYWQCIALAARECHDQEVFDSACGELTRRLQLVRSEITLNEFSAWRYRIVNLRIFAEDVREMIEHPELPPVIFRDSSVQTKLPFRE